MADDLDEDAEPDDPEELDEVALDELEDDEDLEDLEDPRTSTRTTTSRSTTTTTTLWPTTRREDVAVPVAAVVPAGEEAEDDDEEEPDDEDVEASLDVILKERLVVEDEPEDDELTDAEDRSRGVRAGAAQAGRRVRLPVLLPREARQPAGRQEARGSAATASDRAARRGRDRRRRGAPERCRTERHRVTAERLLDLLVFAPAQLALSTLRDLEHFDEIAAKGRERFGLQVNNARVVGQFVVATGRAHLEHLVGGLATRDEPAVGDPPAADSAITAAAEPPAAVADGAEADLAIPDYEALSASQVVRRLDGLGPDELEALYSYETATRGRRTILHRAQQLLGLEDAAGPDSGRTDRTGVEAARAASPGDLERCACSSPTRSTSSAASAAARTSAPLDRGDAPSTWSTEDPDRGLPRRHLHATRWSGLAAGPDRPRHRPGRPDRVLLRRTRCPGGRGRRRR